MKSAVELLGEIKAFVAEPYTLYQRYSLTTIEACTLLEEIERLQSLVGAARVGDGLAEIKKHLGPFGNVSVPDETLSK